MTNANVRNVDKGLINDRLLNLKIENESFSLLFLWLKA